MKDNPTAPLNLTDLAGIAKMAGVALSNAQQWPSIYANFPEVIEVVQGVGEKPRNLYDKSEVAEFLRTRLGKTKPSPWAVKDNSLGLMFLSMERPQ